MHSFATGWQAQANRMPIVTGEGKSRRYVDVPLPGVVHHPGANLDELPDDRVYRRLDALATECRIPNHVQQIAGNTSGEKSGLIGCKPMTTRFVPSEGILPLFYPVFNLSSESDDRLRCYSLSFGLVGRGPPIEATWAGPD